MKILLLPARKRLVSARRKKIDTSLFPPIYYSLKDAVYEILKGLIIDNFAVFLPLVLSFLFGVATSEHPVLSWEFLWHWISNPINLFGLFVNLFIKPRLHRTSEDDEDEE